MRLTLSIVNTLYRRFECFVCGLETSKDCRQVLAVDEDGDEQGIVCTHCLTSVDALQARAAAHAAQLRRYADALDAVSVAVMVTDIERQKAIDFAEAFNDAERIVVA